MTVSRLLWVLFIVNTTALFVQRIDYLNLNGHRMWLKRYLEVLLMSKYENPSVNVFCSQLALMCDSRQSLKFMDQNNGSQFFTTPHVHVVYWHIHARPQGAQHQPPPTPFIPLPLGPGLSPTAYHPAMYMWIGGQLWTEAAVHHTLHAAVTKWTLDM